MAIAGSLDPSLDSEASNRQVSEGAEVRLAPGYVTGTRLDLALIRLKRPFEWRTNLVQPVCLPDLARPAAANIARSFLQPPTAVDAASDSVNKTLDSTKTGISSLKPFFFFNNKKKKGNQKKKRQSHFFLLAPTNDFKSALFEHSLIADPSLIRLKNSLLLFLVISSL